MKKLIILTVSTLLSVGAFAAQNMTSKKCEELLTKSIDENNIKSLKSFLNHKTNCKELFSLNSYIINKDQIEGTALMFAVFKGHTKMVDLLIKAQADVNVEDNNGYAALIIAVLNGHTKIVDLLIKAQADVNAKTYQGITALMWTAFNGNTEIAELLIKAQADVNIQDNNGYTALAIATIKGHTKVVELLIKAGANE